jgi:hypothetical protein
MKHTQLKIHTTTAIRSIRFEDLAVNDCFMYTNPTQPDKLHMKIGNGTAVSLSTGVIFYPTRHDFVKPAVRVTIQAEF